MTEEIRRITIKDLKYIIKDIPDSAKIFIVGEAKDNGGNIYTIFANDFSSQGDLCLYINDKSINND